MNKSKIYEYITKDILFLISPILKDELKKNEDIDSVYIHIIDRFCNIYVFHNEYNSETEIRLKEQINEYIYAFVKYKMDFEKILPNSLTKKIREYLGYNRQLLYLDFDFLPKKLIEEIDEYTNSIFPIFNVRYFSCKLKSILPSKSIEITKN